MKYAELVEKARETYESEDTPHFLKAWLLANIIYPADESEDEKIRKELIEHIKANKEADYVLFKKFSPDDVIAWIEKQGERKSLDADDVIEWLRYHIQVDEPKIEYNEEGQPLAESFLAHAEARCMAADEVVKKFKKDFGL